MKNFEVEERATSRKSRRRSCRGNKTARPIAIVDDDFGETSSESEEWVYFDENGDLYEDGMIPTITVKKELDDDDDYPETRETGISQMVGELGTKTVAPKIDQPRENTPEKLYREFVEEADWNYKAGLPKDDNTKPIDFKATLKEYKDKWDFKISDLLNKENKVQYQCYMENVSSTVGALLGHKYNLNLDIDFKQNRN